MPPALVKAYGRRYKGLDSASQSLTGDARLMQAKAEAASHLLCHPTYSSPRTRNSPCRSLPPARKAKGNGERGIQTVSSTKVEEHASEASSTACWWLFPKCTSQKIERPPSESTQNLVPSVTASSTSGNSKTLTSRKPMLLLGLAARAAPSSNVHISFIFNNVRIGFIFYNVRIGFIFYNVQNEGGPRSGTNAIRLLHALTGATHTWSFMRIDFLLLDIRYLQRLQSLCHINATQKNLLMSKGTLYTTGQYLSKLWITRMHCFDLKVAGRML
jgi:hypothetical protein